MKLWNRIVSYWQKQRIATKFTTMFGFLLLLVIVMVLLGVVSLLVVRNAQKTIESSTNIQRLILEMEHDLETARRLQRDFFMRYPNMGVSAAHEAYALPASEEIVSVIRHSTELQELISTSENSLLFQEQDQIDLNLYLAVSSRYATTFSEAVDLVILLAADETGLQAQLEQKAEDLRIIVQDSRNQGMLASYYEMRSFEKEYLITHERFYIQSITNIVEYLREEIASNPNLTLTQKRQALVLIDDYVTLITNIADINDDLDSRLRDFDLQAESLVPISTALITMAREEVDAAYIRINQTYRFAIVTFIFATLVSLGLIKGIDMVLYRTVTRKLIYLTEAVKEIQAGKIQANLYIDSDDEIGELTVAFNNMTTRIYHAVLELERSEKRYHDLFDRVPVGLFRATHEGKIVDANLAIVEMLAYPNRETLLAANAFDLYVDLEQRHALENILLEKGVSYAYPVQFYQFDHSPIWVEISVRIAYDENGELAFYEGSLKDITLRKQAEEAEREQRALATALVATSDVINSSLDFDKVLELILNVIADVVPHEGANIMLIEDGGLNAHIVRSCDCYTKFGLKKPSTDLTWVIARLPHLQRMVDSGEVLIITDTHEYTGWVERESGNSIRSYIGAPVVIDDQVIGILSVDSTTPGFFDTKHGERLRGFANQAAIALQNAQMFQKLALYNEDLEQAVAERTAELTSTNAELEKLSRAKDDFVANVSHELRTPITNMYLYQSLLRKRPEKLNKYLAIMERETNRLEQIIEDLLRLSRLDQDQKELKLDPIDLNHLLKQFVTDRTLLAQQKEVSLSFNEEIDLPTVFVNQGLFEQVISILLTNAINYTPHDGEVKVWTQTQQFEDRLWAGFSVRDTGPGIYPEERERLFERFFRGKIGQASQKPGTGLGLALAKEIVDRHGGRIDVTSEGIPGQGATFSVWLPINGEDV